MGTVMRCQDLKTGKTLWTAKPEGYGPNSRSVVSAGKFLILRIKSELVVIDSATGKEIGRTDTGINDIKTIDSTGKQVILTTLDRRVISYHVLPEKTP